MQEINIATKAEYRYKDLEKFSKYIGIKEEILMQAFQIENDFHNKIKNESSKINGIM